MTEIGHILRGCSRGGIEADRMCGCGSSSSSSSRVAMVKLVARHSSGAVCESRWPSWAVCPNEPSGFRGCKAILNHASALVTACT